MDTASPVILSATALAKLTALRERGAARLDSLRLYLFRNKTDRFRFVRDRARASDVRLLLEFGELLIDGESLRRLGDRWLDYQVDENGSGRFVLADRC